MLRELFRKRLQMAILTLVKKSMSIVALRSETMQTATKQPSRVNIDTG